MSYDEPEWDERRFSCLECFDTGYITVAHPAAYQRAMKGLPYDLQELRRLREHVARCHACHRGRQQFPHPSKAPPNTPREKCCPTPIFEDWMFRVPWNNFDDEATYEKLLLHVMEMRNRNREPAFDSYNDGF